MRSNKKDLTKPIIIGKKFPVNKQAVEIPEDGKSAEEITEVKTNVTKTKSSKTANGGKK